MKSKLNILVIILLTAFCALSGCASKKKTVDRVKEHSVHVENRDVENTSITEITSSGKTTKRLIKRKFEPSDPSKPMAFGGRKYENTKITEIEIEKTKDTTATAKATNHLKDNSDIKDESDKNGRSTESDTSRISTPVAIGIGLAFLIGIAIFVYKKTS